MGLPPGQHGELFQLKSTSYATLHQVTGRQYLLTNATGDGQPASRANRFWILDSNGEVLREFAPEFHCDCEYGLPIEYEMKDGTLFKYSGRSNDAWTEALCEWQAEIVCVAWKKVDRDDPEAAGVFAALNHHA